MVKAKSCKSGLRSVPDSDGIGSNLSKGLEEKIINPNKHERVRWKKERTIFLSLIFE